MLIIIDIDSEIVDYWLWRYAVADDLWALLSVGAHTRGGGIVIPLLGEINHGNIKRRKTNNLQVILR